MLLRVAPAAWSVLVLLSPPSHRAPRMQQSPAQSGFPAKALATRVRDALIEQEERPYEVWREQERPLKINLDLLTHRARKLNQRGQRRGAIATYKRCIELDPFDGRGWLGLSQIRLKQNRHEEAEELLQQGIKNDPGNPYLLQAYGKLQESRDRPDDALALYQRAVRSKPRHAAAWVALGLLLGKRKKTAAAGECPHRVCGGSGSYYVWQVMGQWYSSRASCRLRAMRAAAPSAQQPQRGDVPRVGRARVAVRARRCHRALPQGPAGAAEQSVPAPVVGHHGGSHR